MAGVETVFRDVSAFTDIVLVWSKSTHESKMVKVFHKVIKEPSVRDSTEDVSKCNAVMRC